MALFAQKHIDCPTCSCTKRITKEWLENMAAKEGDEDCTTGTPQPATPKAGPGIEEALKCADKLRSDLNEIAAGVGDKHAITILATAYRSLQAALTEMQRIAGEHDSLAIIERDAATARAGDDSDRSEKRHFGFVFRLF